MKNILIIADGILAKQFLERLFASKNNSLHNFTIISNEKTLPECDTNFENFKIFDIDPTSKFKLEKTLNSIINKIIIIMQQKDEVSEVYKNIRSFFPNVEIHIVDFWDLDLKDPYLNFINAYKILSTRIMDFLPDSPVLADNIGAGEGEIMEVKVPSGSLYAYRRISSIRKRRWKIAMIYRRNKFELAMPNSVIMPNDTLLVVGEPRILEGVFKAIHNQAGQFPNPFGNNIFAPIDMRTMKEAEIKSIISDAIFIHEKLKSKKLIIKILNPKLNETFSFLKAKASQKIEVVVEYNIDAKFFDKYDLREYDVGLIVTDTRYFKKYKKEFYEAKTPIFKVAKYSFEDVKKSIIIGNKDDAMLLSSPILDVSSQLDLKIDFYSLDDRIGEVKEYTSSLSKLFNKNINIILSQDNPILKLRKDKNILQFVVFDKKTIQGGFFSLFSMDAKKLNYLLEDKFQLFIPEEEN